ncbi:MAG: flagellar basal body P-ring formation protein FlgA [Deltaproteobacteria bacterium]|nr:flagellar basal body P-ring formation protein FlgA [Deltaproteobacteria bacterium]
MMLIISLLLLLPVPVRAKSGSGAERLISQQEVAQVLNDYLAAKSQQLPRVELRFASLSLPKPFKVPQGRIEYQIIPAKPGIIGSRRVTLLIRVDGRLVSNQSIRIELEALAEILVAADNLRRGEVLSPENVSPEQRDISRLKQPLFAGDEIYGKRLKRSLRLGQPLSRNQVEFPPMIKRGERVVIQAQRAGLVLSAAGEAKENGLLDETIRVMNIGSHKEVLCRVVAPGRVTVEF